MYFTDEQCKIDGKTSHNYEVHILPLQIVVFQLNTTKRPSSVPNDTQDILEENFPMNPESVDTKYSMLKKC